MAYSLRRQRLIVMLGFLSVALGWIGYLALVWAEWSPLEGQDRANLIFGVGSVLGYAVLAVASWSWFRWMESSPHLAGLVPVLRRFAVGNLLLAVGLAAIGYLWASHAITQPYDGRSTIVAAMTYGFEFFGFLLAAVAFWDASAEVGTVRPDPSTSEGEFVAA
ncbi:MAG: hypothetical protein ABSF84_02240 [Acidimicrobiales bacterium]|jgi:hypothetical protein